MTFEFGDIFHSQRAELADLKAYMRILIVEELLQMLWLRLTLQFEHKGRAACGTCK